MRHSKIIIGLLTAVFFIAAALCVQQEMAWDGTVSLYAAVPSQGRTETITCWEGAEETYYLFLPGYAELSGIRLYSGTGTPAAIDGIPVEDGMTCENLSLNTAHDLCYTAGDRTFHFPLVLVQSSGIPAAYLDVASGSMDYIHGEKGKEEPGTLRLYAADGSLNYSGTLESVKGRGNATWDAEKKPYSLQLSGEADLLDMGSASAWILLANAYDPTNLRNKIALDLAQAAQMPGSPSCEWVDLYLNGEYAGLYLLTERNEVHPGRVELPQQGGFLISQDFRERLETKELPYVTTTGQYSEFAYRIHDSDLPSDELREILQSCENAILAEDGLDPETGKYWLQLLDLDSWVKKYLLEELLGNLDVGVASQYYFYAGDAAAGKLYAGPVWDYDNILGRYHWQITEPASLIAARPHVMSKEDTPYFHALYQKREFLQRTTELYETLFRPLLQQLLEEGLDAGSGRIARSAAANRIRWGTDDSEDNVEAMKTYLAQRLAFFDSLWLEKEDYCFVQISVGSAAWGCYAVRPGGILPQNLAELAAEGSTWYRRDTGEPFDLTQPVWEDAAISLKNTPAGEQEDSETPQPLPAEETEEPPMYSYLPLLLLLALLGVMAAADRQRRRKTGTNRQTEQVP